MELTNLVKDPVMETGSRIMIQALLEMCSQYKGRGSENAATTATGSGMSEGRFARRSYI